MKDENLSRWVSFYMIGGHPSQCQRWNQRKEYNISAELSLIRDTAHCKFVLYNSIKN
jgi:hypothetical protein